MAYALQELQSYYQILGAPAMVVRTVQPAHLKILQYFASTSVTHVVLTPMCLIVRLVSHLLEE